MEEQSKPKPTQAKNFNSWQDDISKYLANIHLMWTGENLFVM